MSACTIDECGEKSPWICHVCDTTGHGEAQACAQCYMVTCAAHLQTKVVYNEESKLYVFQKVCQLCAAQAVLE